MPGIRNSSRKGVFAKARIRAERMCVYIYMRNILKVSALLLHVAVNYKELNCIYYGNRTCESTQPQVSVFVINNTYYQQAEDIEDELE
jgi:hypothetical protein